METKKQKEIKPSLFIAMPCYDSVKINTMLSVVKLIQQLGRSGIEVGIHTMKSPLIHQARNYLTSVFLTTQYQYLLFIDSDVEFEPEAALRMMVAKKNIVCTPYRVKSTDINKHIYGAIEFKDPKNILVLAEGFVEIETGPTGLMLIDRKVFERIIKNHPELKITNEATPKTEKSHKFYYNFFDFGFNEGLTMGEDVSFCRLARDNDFRIFANIKSSTVHHGSFAWKGTFGESLKA